MWAASERFVKYTQVAPFDIDYCEVSTVELNCDIIHQKKLYTVIYFPGNLNNFARIKKSLYLDYNIEMTMFSK